MINRLYYGDCLEVVPTLPPASVDLVYLDPPFNSNRAYNAIYSDSTGRPLPTQIEAFCDTWTLDAEQERAIRTIPVLRREAGIDDETAQFWRLWMNAMRHTQPRLLAYLAYMVQRLLPLRRALTPIGSLYLHCDPTASHYIKVMLDSIFGHDNFRSEIVWKRSGGFKRRTARKFPAKHDVILFYGNSPSQIAFDPQYVPHKPEYIARFKPDASGRLYRDDVNPTGGGRRVIYLDETPGDLIDDVWTDIAPVNPAAKERMGYPTQKPAALLRRIIAASSPPGGVVLDPFCGCATTLEAAHDLGRNWIGIDIAIHAIKRVAKARLEDRLGLVEGTDFTISGIPNSFDSALDLWTRDKYHFQKWAVEQVDGFVSTKRTADGGIDGRIYFPLNPEAKDLESMAVEVKGGRNVSIEALRALRGVLERDEAVMAGLIILHPMGDQKARNFRRFMAEAGTLEAEGRKFERMQMLTVTEILDGNHFNTPGAAGRGLAKPVIPGLKLPPKSQAPNL